MKHIYFLLTIESMPRKNSITKKVKAQKLGAGIIETAAGYVMKANPGPALATCPTGTPVLSAAKPRTENTTNPAQILVPLFTRGIRMDDLRKGNILKSTSHLHN